MALIMKLNNLFSILLLGLLIWPGMAFAYSNNPTWEKIIPSICYIENHTEVSKEELQNWRKQRNEELIKLSENTPKIINEGNFILENIKINNQTILFKFLVKEGFENLLEAVTEDLLILPSDSLLSYTMKELDKTEEGREIGFLISYYPKSGNDLIIIFDSEEFGMEFPIILKESGEILNLLDEQYPNFIFQTQK